MKRVVGAAFAWVLLAARTAHADEPDLDEEALRRFSYDDPTNAMLSVPGVHVRPEDPYGIRVAIGARGLRNVALLEDGVPSAPAPYSAPTAVWLPLFNRVQSARIEKAPVDEGRATLDLATREIPKDGHRGTYDLALGRFLGNREHVAIGAGGESIGFVLEGMRLDTSGFQKVDSGGDTGFTRNDFMGKARWSPDPRADVVNDFGMKLTYADEGSNIGALGLTDADFAADPDRRYAAAAADRIESRRFGTQLSHELRVSPRVSITTVLYRNEMTLDRRGLDGLRGAVLASVLGDPETPDKTAYRGALAGTRDLTDPARALLRGTEHHAFVSEGVQSRVKAEATTGPLRHRLGYGVRAHYDEDARTKSDEGLLVFSGAYLPDGGVAGAQADEKAYTYAAAMWAVDAMTIGDVTIAPSVRVEEVHAALRDSLTGG
ncbi:MAG TPA: ligand-gated channel protein, partial [Labilithrix sp.]